MAHAPNVPIHLNPGASGLALLGGPHANPPYNIDQNSWGRLSFAAGQTEYFDPEHDQYHIANTAAFKVIGSNGMASCMGVVIVSQTHAVVAHFSPDWPGNNEGFEEFVARYAANLQGAHAWMVIPAQNHILHPSADSMRDVTWITNMLEHTLHLPAANIKRLNFKQPDDANQTYGNAGEGSVVVDARNCTGHNQVLPEVYVFDYVQSYP